jgi:hypothetical protein
VVFFLSTLLLRELESVLVKFFSKEVGQLSRGHLGRHCAKHLLEIFIKACREKKTYLDFDSRFEWRPAGGRISSLSSLDSAQNFLQGFLHGEVLILLSGSLQQKRFWKMAVVSPPREVFITAIRLADKVCSEKTWRRIVLFMSALDCLLA